MQQKFVKIRLKKSRFPNVMKQSKRTTFPRSKKYYNTILYTMNTIIGHIFLPNFDPNFKDIPFFAEVEKSPYRQHYNNKHNNNIHHHINNNEFPFCRNTQMSGNTPLFCISPL